MVASSGMSGYYCTWWCDLENSRPSRAQDGNTIGRDAALTDPAFVEIHHNTLFGSHKEQTFPVAIISRLERRVHLQKYIAAIRSREIPPSNALHQPLEGGDTTLSV